MVAVPADFVVAATTVVAVDFVPVATTVGLVLVATTAVLVARAVPKMWMTDRSNSAAVVESLVG